MKSKVIGVLGSGGAVGYAATENLLKEGYTVIGGQRSEKTLFSQYSNFCLLKVDIFDNKSLNEFCDKCDIILNCAGPSYIIGDKVAIAALSQHKSYVDSFGVVLSNSKGVSKLANNGCCVIGAGTVPGISGIMAGEIVGCLDEVKYIKEYSGGMETATKSSITDVFMSSVSGYGISESFYSNNKIVRSNEVSKFKKKIYGFGQDVYCKMFLYNELVEAAKYFGIKEIYSYNVSNSMRTNQIMTKLMTKYLLKPTLENLDKCVLNVLKYNEIEMFGRKPEYIVSLEAKGKKKGIKKEVKMSISMRQSYLLTALIASMNIIELLKHPDLKGIKWTFEMLKLNEILPRLSDIKCVFNIAGSNSSNLQEEEGEI